MASDNKKVVRRIKATTDKTPASVAKKPVGDSSVKAKAKSKSVVKSTGEVKAAVKASTPKVSSTKVGKSVAQSANRDSDRKPFILFRPFIAMGHYVAESWRELHRVEWPNRRATWKMTLGVLIFCLVIGLFVLLCDWVSQWLIQEVVL